MNRFFKALFLILVTVQLGASQQPASTPPPRTNPVQIRPATTFNLNEYGVSFEADTRLIVMMTALEAAGWDPTPPGREPSVFRAQVRKDIGEVDPELRSRLRVFFERNKLAAPATAADQASRYISLALAMGQPPALDAPERSEELPGGLLEVLDFAPLVREFYRRSGLEERLVSYTRAYQAEGDRLRQPTAEMVRAILSYLHTRPITVSVDRVLLKPPATRKNAPRTYSTRARERRFYILPDLLAAQGTINFRIIADEYYAIVPQGTDPNSSELRRAYLQFVIDPLAIRFNREIAERREHIKQILAEREKEGSTVSPDVFLVVSRSLVAAADARFEESRRLEALTHETRPRLLNARDEATKAAIFKDTQILAKSIQDGTIARLADEYERGAVLSFFFADQLKDIETSGFDIANFFPDMIASFDPAREIKRPAEYAEARQRAQADKQSRAAARQAESETTSYSPAEAAKAASLVRSLSQVEEMLRLKDYTNAETRLKELFKEHPREPRVFFALAQTASLAAQDATDEDVRDERLKRALANYRFALEASSPETDRGLISRAHEAMGRIHAFMENLPEASKEFDEAIKIGDVRGGAYKEAVAGKKLLEQP